MLADYYNTWLWESVAGLLLVGTGLSVIGHAVTLKVSRQAVAKWVVWGTIGLIAVGAGLSLFGDAVKQRTLYESTRVR